MELASGSRQVGQELLDRNSARLTGKKRAGAA